MEGPEASEDSEEPNGDAGAPSDSGDEPAQEWELPEGAVSSGSRKLEPPSVEEIASHFTRYEILDFLGWGGFSAVYRARQISMGREVALKVLLDWDASDPSSSKRFEREAIAMAQLSHPNIVKVFEYGQTKSGMPFFSMECLTGGTIRKLVKDKTVEPDEKLRVLLQVCEALEYAHHRGIVHRDIKPENILLDADGRVKVTDFGLAKIAGPQATQASIARTRGAVGTLGYIAPEQCDDSISVDHRADIYSLGVVLYELLTGAIPRGAFKPPSVMVPGLDPRLDPVVVKAMLSEPDQRFQAVSEMQTNLDAIRSGAPIPEPTPISVETAPEPEPNLETGKVVFNLGSDRPRSSDKPTPTPRPAKRKTSGSTIAVLGSLAAVLLIGAFFLWKTNQPSQSESGLPKETAQGKLGQSPGPKDPGNSGAGGKAAKLSAIALGKPVADHATEGRLIPWLMGKTGGPPDPFPLIDPRARAIHSSMTREGPDSIHFAALLANGEARFWGNNEHGQCDPPEELETVTAIALGTTHSLALDSEGKLFAWGDNRNGQCEVPDDLGAVASVIAGDSYGAVLLKNGEVRVWGSDATGVLRVPGAAKDLVALAGGPRHLAALTKDGRVVCWGENTGGACDVPPGLGGVKTIACFDNATLAVGPGGKNTAWGEASLASLVETLPPIARVKPGNLIELADGTWRVLRAGEKTESIGGDTMGPIVDLALGHSHCFGILPDAPKLVSTPVETGPVQGRYLRLETSDPGAIGGIAEIEIYSKDRNIALGKQFTGSSGITPEQLAALNDGIIFTEVGDDKAAGWIEVDLGTPASIRRIEVRPTWKTGSGATARFSLSILDMDRSAADTRPLTVFGDAVVTLAYHGTTDPAPPPSIGPVTTEAEAATPPGSPGPKLDSRVLGDYFKGQEFQRPVASRQDSAIRFTWDPGVEPVPGSGVSQYSVRWRGMVTPEKSGQYTFIATIDDGVRLWVAGELLVDAWIDSVVREHRAEITLIEGKPVPLRMEFYQAGGAAEAQLEWQGPELTRQVVPFSLRPPIEPAGESADPAEPGGITALPLTGASSVSASMGLPPEGEDFVRIEADSAATDGVDGSGHAVALREDGTLVAWGEPADVIYIPPGLESIIDFSISPAYCLALRADGTVIPFGRIAGPNLDVPGDIENAIAVAAGEWHGLALVDGKVRAWGRNGKGQCNVPDSLDSVTAIAAGTTHSVALTGDGSVVAWGDNENGQCTPPPWLSGVAAISATKNASFALIGDGTLVKWGSNQPEPATYRGIQKLGGASRNSICVRKKDGTWWLLPDVAQELRELPGSESAHDLASVGKIAVGLQPITEAHRRLSALDVEFSSKWKERFGAEIEANQKTLDANYRKALERDLQKAIAGTDLESAVAIRREINRIDQHEGMPNTIPPGIPGSLENSMRIYAREREKIEDRKLAQSGQLRAEYNNALNQLAAEFDSSPPDRAEIERHRGQIALDVFWQKKLEKWSEPPPVVEEESAADPLPPPHEAFPKPLPIPTTEVSPNPPPDEANSFAGAMKALEQNPTEAAAQKVSDWLLAEAEQAGNWKVLEATEMASNGGATLTAQDDGSILSSGVHPDRDTYTITAPVGSSPVNCLAIDTLPLDSLPGQGAGRGNGGRFMITEVEVLGRSGSGDWIPIQLIDAAVDFAGSWGENEFGAAYVIDGAKGPHQRGWQVIPMIKKPHRLILKPAESIAADVTELTVIIQQNHFNQAHSKGLLLGRFRLSVSGEERIFDREKVRLAALGNEEPWERLSSAFESVGRKSEFDRLKELVPDTKSTPDNILEIANAHYKDSNWKEALAYYNQLVTPNSNDTWLLARRAEVFEKAGMPEESEADWKRIIDLKPAEGASPDFWLDILTQGERWNEIARYYDGVLPQMPQPPNTRASHSAICRKIYELIRRDDPVFEALRAIRPNDSLLQAGLARDHVMKCEWEKAAAVYPQGFTNEKYHDELYEAAATLLLAGRTEDYKKFMSTWVSAMPDLTEAPMKHYAVARAAVVCPGETIPWPQVMTWAEKAATGEEERPWFFHVAGLANLRAGNLDKAAEWLGRSGATTWQPELNQIALCLLSIQRGETEKARAYLEQARNWLEEKERSRRDDYYQVQVTDWLEFNLLFPEAEALLKDR